MSMWPAYPIMSKRKNILLIEPNVCHQKITQKALEHKSQLWNLHTSLSFDETLPLVKKKHFDLILAENLNSNSPANWCFQLRKNAPDTPLVILTSITDQKIAVESMKMGATDYLIKSRDIMPRLPKILMKIIEKRVNQKKKKTDDKKGPLSLVAKNLKTLTEIVSDPSKGFHAGKQQLHLLEREIENIKQHLKNLLN